MDPPGNPNKNVQHSTLIDISPYLLQSKFEYAFVSDRVSQALIMLSSFERFRDQLGVCFLTADKRAAIVKCSYPDVCCTQP
jgi:hypothetical protein